jgi:predicted esterase
MKVIKDYLTYADQKTNALIFLPDDDVEICTTAAIFTHGYTSDKSSIINWPIRLAEIGVPCVLFDLPGHYLGNFSEVNDFDYFTKHAHELFYSAFLLLNNFIIDEVVLGGHSLGAMLALKALNLSQFNNLKTRAIGVGIGMAPKNVVHLFDTPFYKTTLNLREQLVSPALNSSNVFPWIKQEKEVISLSNKTIHLITGLDDLVVGNDGTERFKEQLEAQGNIVTLERPTRLPHHEPQLAASHVKKYLKQVGIIEKKN